MRSILWIFITQCVPPAFSQNAARHSEHIKYTKFQRQAAGFWRVTEAPQGANVKWLVIGLADSPNTMTVRWPTGLGCSTESAEIHADTITVVGDHFPAVIQIRGSKTATLSMFGGQITLHIRKTKEATDFLCE
jgi:hypothetical protein